MSKPTARFTRVTDVEVDVDIELTREELIDALRELGRDAASMIEADLDVASVLRDLDYEMISSRNILVREALLWARNLVAERLA